jgi:hypothetical protein
LPSSLSCFRSKVSCNVSRAAASAAEPRQLRWHDSSLREFLARDAELTAKDASLRLFSPCYGKADVVNLLRGESNPLCCYSFGPAAGLYGRHSALKRLERGAYSTSFVCPMLLKTPIACKHASAEENLNTMNGKPPVPSSAKGETRYSTRNRLAMRCLNMSEPVSTAHDMTDKSNNPFIA